MRMDNIFGMKARKANAIRVRKTFLKSSSKALQNMPLRAFDEDFRNVEISVSQVLLREGNVHRCSSGKVSTMSMPRARPGPRHGGEGGQSHGDGYVIDSGCCRRCCISCGKACDKLACSNG